jgi:hypothetical protein
MIVEMLPSDHDSVLLIESAPPVSGIWVTRSPNLEIEPTKLPTMDGLTEDQFISYKKLSQSYGIECLPSHPVKREWCLFLADTYVLRLPHQKPRSYLAESIRRSTAAAQAWLCFYCMSILPPSYEVSFSDLSILKLIMFFRLTTSLSGNSADHMPTPI